LPAEDDHDVQTSTHSGRHGDHKLRKIEASSDRINEETEEISPGGSQQESQYKEAHLAVQSRGPGSEAPLRLQTPCQADELDQKLEEVSRMAGK